VAPWVVLAVPVLPDPALPPAGAVAAPEAATATVGVGVLPLSPSSSRLIM
jgi:hypothetical protein